jgi:hypothetical protein
MRPGSEIDYTPPLRSVAKDEWSCVYPPPLTLHRWVGAVLHLPLKGLRAEIVVSL